MLKKILLGIGLALLLFLAFVATRSDTYTVQRSATIAAPADVVFGMINDFHQWEAWSPWAKIDPAMKTTYTGPTAGPGAIYHWVGNSDVGEGQMEVLESKLAELVKIKLDFIKPFASTNATDFTLKPATGGVTVTWNMVGQKDFMAKAVFLFMDMDKTIGGDFEKGLAQLKAGAEAKK